MTKRIGRQRFIRLFDFKKKDVCDSLNLRNKSQKKEIGGKVMKKLFALLLALCMAWSLVGCAQPAKEPDAGTESSAAPVET